MTDFHCSDFHPLATDFYSPLVMVEISLCYCLDYKTSVDSWDFYFSVYYTKDSMRNSSNTVQGFLFTFIYKPDKRQCSERWLEVGVSNLTHFKPQEYFFKSPQQ